MTDPKPEASELVMTQAELPPGIDAPSPPKVRDRSTGEVLPADVAREIRKLAQQVGGFPRLRTLVDELARTGE